MAQIKLGRPGLIEAVKQLIVLRKQHTLEVDPLDLDIAYQTLASGTDDDVTTCLIPIHRCEYLLYKLTHYWVIDGVAERRIHVRRLAELWHTVKDPHEALIRLITNRAFSKRHVVWAQLCLWLSDTDLEMLLSRGWQYDTDPGIAAREVLAARAAEGEGLAALAARLRCRPWLEEPVETLLAIHARGCGAAAVPVILDIPDYMAAVPPELWEQVLLAMTRVA
jgi:hypothetical protein